MKLDRTCEVSAPNPLVALFSLPFFNRSWKAKILAIPAHFASRESWVTPFLTNEISNLLGEDLCPIQRHSYKRRRRWSCFSCLDYK